MKQFRAWMLAGLLAGALSACGAPAASTPSTAEPAATSAPPATTAPAATAPLATLEPTTELAPTEEAATADTSASAAAVPTSEVSATTAATTSAGGSASADCQGITEIDTSSTQGQQILALAQAAYQAFGEGNTTAKITNLQQIVISDQGWAIVEADFDQAESGVLLLRPTQRGFALATVWGGIVERPGQIQEYFAEQAPDAPQQLLDCYQPAGQFVPTS